MWKRPVPVVGDVSAASQRAAQPDGWAFPDADRQAFYSIVGARRDVRRFRPDPIDPAVIDRVLLAAHQGPSVGHSQPWRFITVRAAATRERAVLMADRHRLAQAALLEPEAARRLMDLQLQGIRDAPLGVVVCCDRRTAATGVLGRATFPDADLWSCACAIENLWLAARAEGLGLGWVTLFEPTELAALLDLPDGVVTLGWLCLGWPDERPPEPGLERAGWSHRLPLTEVVLPERWPAEHAPAAPVSRLRSPAAPVSRLRSPDQRAVVGARDEADRLLTPPGSLGVLDRAVDTVIALGQTHLTGGTLVLAAADHPVAARRVSAYPASVTREVVAASAAGEGFGVTAARTAGLGVELVDAGIAGPPITGVPRVGVFEGRGDLVTADALAPAEVRELIDVGIAIGTRIGDTGLVALGEVGVANTTVAAALTVALLDADPESAVGLGVGADTAMLDRKLATVVAAVARAREQHGDRLRDPLVALGALGGGEFALLTGVVLGACERGAVIVLDGLATSLAALAAVGIEPAVAAHLVAGQRSRERAHELVLVALGCEPLLDLRIRSGEGVGAVLAARLLLQALTIRNEAGRVAY